MDRDNSLHQRASDFNIATVVDMGNPGSIDEVEYYRVVFYKKIPDDETAAFNTRYQFLLESRSEDIPASSGLVIGRSTTPVKESFRVVRS